MKDKSCINDENKGYKFKWIKLFKDTIINNNYNIEKLKKTIMEFIPKILYTSKKLS